MGVYEVNIGKETVNLIDILFEGVASGRYVTLIKDIHRIARNYYLNPDMELELGDVLLGKCVGNGELNPHVFIYSWYGLGFVEADGQQDFPELPDVLCKRCESSIFALRTLENFLVELGNKREDLYLWNMLKI